MSSICTENTTGASDVQRLCPWGLRPDSPVPSLSPASRPCRKQRSSSFPLDAGAGTHPLLSPGGSAGSLLDDRGTHQHVGSLRRCPSAGLHHLSLCLGASSSCGALCLWASSCVCIALSSSCRTNNKAERCPPRLHERTLPWRPAL